MQFWGNIQTTPADLVQPQQQSKLFKTALEHEYFTILPVSCVTALSKQKRSLTS